MPVTDDLDREAAARHEQHKDQKSSRPLAPDYQKTGLIAERWYEHEYGVQAVWRSKPFDDLRWGDDGYDFVQEMWLTPTVRRRVSIDVKGAKAPRRTLYVAEGEVKAQVYVLIGVDEVLGNGFIGWAWRREVLAAPVTRRTVNGFEMVSHTLRGHTLRTKREYDARLLTVLPETR